MPLLAVAAAFAEGPAGPPSDPGKVRIEDTAGSVTGSLQGQEGVRIQTMCTHCNSANIQVGGLAADLVPITFGGFPLFGGLATSFVMSMLPSDSVSEAQVTRGPGEPKAPAAAAGGTIALAAATPKELPSFYIDLLGGTYNRRAGTFRAAGAVTKWLSGIATFGREQADAVRSPVGDFNSIAAVDRNIADGRFIVAPSRDHRIELGVSYIRELDPESKGAFDTIAWLMAGLPDQSLWTREDSNFERTEYRAGWDWRLKSAGTVSLKLLRGSRDLSVKSQDSASGPLSLRYQIGELNQWGELRYSQPIGLAWRVVLGVESTTERVEADAYQGLGPGSTEEVGRHSQNALDRTTTWAGYGEAGFTPDAHWDIVAGVRADRIAIEGAATNLLADPSDPNYQTSDTVTKTYASPRLTVKYHAGNGLSARLVAGKTSRAPKSSFAEVCCGRQYLTNVQAGVRPETATTYALEGLYQPSPELKASIYLARTDFSDHVIQLVPYSFLYRQIYANTNIPEARSETLELAGRWTAADWLRLDASAGWLSFRNTGAAGVPVNYRDFTGSTEVKTTVLQLDRIPNRPVASGSLGANITLPYGATLSLQGNYTGEQFIQQWEKITSPSQIQSFSQNFLLQELRHVAGFTMVNIGLTVPLGKQVELSAGIDNLTGKYQYDLDDPTRDYNWGPLTGRTYRVGARLRFDEKGF